MRRKITDKKGATLIFAMVIFLIATIVSLTVVSIARTNVQKVRRQRQEQQATLAVTSAAKYVQHLFDGCSYYFDKDVDDWVVAYGDSELGKIVKKNDLNAASYEDGFKTILEGSTKDNPVIWTIKSSLSNNSADDALEVKLSCFLDDKDNEDKYNNRILVKISQEQYSLTLVFTVNRFDDENGKKEYTWSYSYVDRLTNNASGGASSG